MRLSPQEIMTFKEKSDQLLIKPGKLFINYENILGHGSSSTIYKGHISGPSPLHLSTQLIETQTFCDCDVAVKVARNFGSGEVELLYKEIQALKTLGYHENISCMLGWAIPGETPCLVFDIAKMDLLQYVRGFRDAAKGMVPYKDFLSFLWQITRGELVEIYLIYSLGMQYITSKQMIHRDLAARNILLTNNNVAKISDFGLCCTYNDGFSYQASLAKKLPIKWLSLEALTDHVFSEKSDVWAFGVLIYEMFAYGLVPYTTMHHDEVLAFLQEGNRLGCPEDMPNELYEITRKCWEENPDDRYTFADLEQKFRVMIENATESYGYLS
uniref:Protein kinase domain-containing protein n=1 Tax=Acrobeloides nanus TaxID=290746 RepID=A0A914E5T0_9BILA